MILELGKAIQTLLASRETGSLRPAIVEAAEGLLGEATVILLDDADLVNGVVDRVGRERESPDYDILGPGDERWIRQYHQKRMSNGFVENGRIIVALTGPSKTFGSLFAKSAHVARIFREEDLALLSVFAAHAATLLEIAELNRRVDDLERKQGEFVSLVTHELRLPMTSISGYAELIMSGAVGPLPDRQREFLSRIKRNVDRMGDLIHALSEINRIQGKRKKFKIESIDPKSEVLVAIKNAENEVRESQHRLEVDLPEALPQVAADRAALGVALSNLLTNACRYTLPGGLISVSANSDESNVEISINDNGIGMSEEDQRQLFTPFFRSEDARVREYAGWGLGLLLARTLIEAQGGRLSFRSQMDKGSTFTLTLPAMG